MEEYTKAVALSPESPPSVLQDEAKKVPKFPLWLLGRPAAPATPKNATPKAPPAPVTAAAATTAEGAAPNKRAKHARHGDGHKPAPTESHAKPPPPPPPAAIGRCVPSYTPTMQLLAERRKQLTAEPAIPAEYPNVDQIMQRDVDGSFSSQWIVLCSTLACALVEYPVLKASVPAPRPSAGATPLAWLRTSTQYFKSFVAAPVKTFPPDVVLVAGDSFLELACRAMSDPDARSEQPIFAQATSWQQLVSIACLFLPTSDEHVVADMLDAFAMHYLAPASSQM